MSLALPARFAAAALMAGVLLSACATRPPTPAGPPAGVIAPGTAGRAQPAPSPPAASVPAPSEHPAPAPQRQFRLSPASSALVAQAHRQSGAGDYGEAAATLERALRIEPDNPLLWIELGRVRMGESNPAQADAMGRKALALAGGDAAAQAAAWRLIADSLRARGRNADAYEADRRASSLTSQAMGRNAAAGTAAVR